MKTAAGGARGMGGRYIEISEPEVELLPAGARHRMVLVVHTLTAGP